MRDQESETSATMGSTAVASADRGEGSRSRRALLLLLAVALAVGLMPAVPGEAQPERVENPHDACPDDVNPPAPFADRMRIPEVHRLNVDCAYNNDIARGFNDNTFRPRLDVRRDQFASFLVRTMQAADVDLPEPSDQGFRDIDGNEHEDNINILAATGITEGVTRTEYGPSRNLRRDQVASFILRAAAYIEDVPLENLQRDDGPFADVAQANVHRPNINGARVLNLALGRSDTEYFPGAATKRDQMASFLIRLLAALSDDAPLVPAELRATSLELTPAQATLDSGDEHTVTATVTDERDEPVEDVDVRLEVYRDDASTPSDTYTGPEHVDFGETDADGEIVFAYTGPEFEAEDRLVACVLDPEREHCQVEGGDGEDVSFTGDPDVDARVHDTAEATWDDSRVDGVIIEDEDDRWAVNPLGTDHTVTATVQDPDGEGVADAAIRFEVYRAEVETVEGIEDEDDLDDLEFSGPVEEEDLRTGDDGRASFTYTGPDDDAVDRIVICRAVRGSCLVVDEDGDTDGTQFTGDPDVGAEPNAVATKLWDSRLEVPQPAEYARALGSGLEIAGEVGDGLSDGLGDVLGDIPIAELLVQPPTPLVEVEAADGDEERQVSDGAEVLNVPGDPLVEATVLEAAALVDLDLGLAHGEASAADVEVLPDAVDEGVALVAADAIEVEAHAVCPIDDDPTSDAALEAASEGTDFIGLEIAGTGGQSDIGPNTTILPEELEGLAQVRLREVTPIDEAGEATDEDDEVVGYRVRGLVVEVLNEAGDQALLEIVVGAAEAEVHCENGDADVTAAGGGETEESEEGAEVQSATALESFLSLISGSSPFGILP